MSSHTEKKTFVFLVQYTVQQCQLPLVPHNEYIHWHTHLCPLYSVRRCQPTQTAVLDGFIAVL